MILPIRLLSVVFLLGLAIAGSAFGQMRTPPGVPTSEEIAPAKQLGLKLPLSYSAARKLMVKSSWRIDLSMTSAPAAYPKHPEISCGNGLDAVCSARFLKHGRAIQLIVDQTQPGLPVVHVYED
jgi:hypothetical protein